MAKFDKTGPINLELLTWRHPYLSRFPRFNVSLFKSRLSLDTAYLFERGLHSQPSVSPVSYFRMFTCVSLNRNTMDLFSTPDFSSTFFRSSRHSGTP